jgi:hypothetical protein
MTSVTLAQAQNAGAIAAHGTLTAIQTELQAALAAGLEITSSQLIDPTSNAMTTISGFTMSAADSSTLLNNALTALANDLASSNNELANL